MSRIAALLRLKVWHITLSYHYVWKQQNISGASREQISADVPEARVMGLSQRRRSTSLVQRFGNFEAYILLT